MKTREQLAEDARMFIHDLETRCDPTGEARDPTGEARDLEGRVLMETDKGKAVRYIPLHANGDRSHPDVEDGRISSWNAHYVFVKYGPGSTSQATSPDDLVWG